MGLTLDNSRWELRHQYGHWHRSTLRRIGVAATAAGIAPEEDSAHAIVWEALLGVGEHVPARRALELAGLDVAAIERELVPLARAYSAQLRSEELAGWRWVAEARAAS